MPEDTGDWRLRGQERYLTGATFLWTTYQQTSQQWDHDHCEFCWAKFSADPRIEDALREGWATRDLAHWLCPTCLDDFQGPLQLLRVGPHV